MKNLFICMLILVSGLSACKKRYEFDEKEQAKQAAIDEQLIKDFIAANSIVALRHASGIYYVISEPGSGNVVYNKKTNVTVHFTGRLLNGTVFGTNVAPTDPFVTPMDGLLSGWQIGLQLIQEGGKIRLLIPSKWGYQQSVYGAIPSNSVLDFDIELLDVN